jgi:predicted oxidoreductase
MLLALKNMYIKYWWMVKCGIFKIMYNKIYKLYIYTQNHNLGYVEAISENAINKLDWSVYIRPSQLYDGREMHRIYYIKNNYMFRHFTLAIFRLRNEKT